MPPTSQPKKMLKDSLMETITDYNTHKTEASRNMLKDSLMETVTKYTNFPLISIMLTLRILNIIKGQKK